MSPSKSHDQPCPRLDPASAFSPSNSNPRQQIIWKKLHRCMLAAGKSFAIGACLKGSLTIFSILTQLKKRRLPASAKEPITETLRYGLFLGTFAATFVSIDECIAFLGGNRKTARWRALFAGAIAGPSMLLTGPNTQHTSLAIYILTRAAVLATRCGINSKRFGYIFKPLTWSHGDVLLMCLSSSQILSAYVLNQDSLPSSYKSFLNTHGGKESVILQGIKDVACSMPFANLDGIEKHYKAVGVDIKLDPMMKVPCSIVHGNRSCLGHFFWFLLRAYTRALLVYLPLYSIQGLLKWTTSVWRKCFFEIGRSSLFLSAYCSSAWIWSCLLFRLCNRCNIPLVVLSQFPTGLALWIEKKSRRMEISLYCFARAIESFFMCVKDASFFSPAMTIKRADIAMFSLSTAIIMHCYAREREVFRSKYLNVLDWVFGVPLSCKRDLDHFFVPK